MTSLNDNPFAILTAVVAPAILTNACSVLGLGTAATIGILAWVLVGVLGLFFAANGSQFGLPSNLVYTSGPLDATIDLATNSLTSLNNPHVLLDVCAALA